MNKKKLLVQLLFLLLITVSQAENQFFIQPNPEWIQTIEYDKNFHLYNDNKEDGGTYLLLDYQQNIDFQESFRHFAIKIEEETGIQNYSDIWIDYDPSYEQLIFHKLLIHRDNKIINKLQKKNFKIVQNETQLERKIYSGNYSAGINIEDVQVGDIIEYSYTIKGENPIFKGKYFDRYNLEYSVPINKLYLQITYPANRPIQYKLIKTDHNPEVLKSNNNVTLKWELTNIPEVVLNSNLPSWFIAYGKVQFSEFNNWTDVIEWSKPLYIDVNIEGTELEQQYANLIDHVSGTEKKINELIRFVQDEVRYVGIEVNEYSHKPHNPVEVYKKRFGDCKDKTYLLITLLNKLGINAWPAYVNTSLRQNINEFLPSPTIFNHVIVALEFNGQTYFIDPTISNQRGDFRKAYNGNYKSALILNNENDKPIEIPSNKFEKIVIHERIEASDTAAPATYNITSTYFGGEADKTRSNFKSMTQKELENAYLNFYDYLYPKMRVINEIGYDDNHQANEISVKEQYEIDNFWIFNDAPDINDYVANINAINLENYVTNPSQRNRSMPFAIYYPIEIENKIEFSILKNINIDEEKGTIENSCFKFTYDIHKKGNNIVFIYTYKALKDHVTTDEFERYFLDIDKLSNQIWYEFTFGADSEPKESFNYLMAVIALFFTTLLIFIASKLYKKDIEPLSLSNNGIPIGGWLVIPAIGVFISPIVFIYTTFTAGFFDQSAWEYISSIDSAGYNATWAFVFLMELLMNCLFLVYSIFLIILLVQKRTIFPIHYVSFRIINLVFLIADLVLVGTIDSEHFTNDASDMQELSRTIISAFVWIPYMLLSQRVKDTFTNKIKVKKYE